MCEFLDVDGVSVEIGDIVEHWKPKTRTWERYEVKRLDVEKYRRWNSAETVTEIKLSIQKNGSHYPVVVKQSNNIRKVL